MYILSQRIIDDVVSGYIEQEMNPDRPEQTPADEHRGIELIREV